MLNDAFSWESSFLSFFSLLLILASICDAGHAVFDASQYAFFGNDVVEEVELGGLEDEEEDIPAVGADEDYQLDQQEVCCFFGCFFEKFD